MYLNLPTLQLICGQEATLLNVRDNIPLVCSKRTSLRFAAEIVATTTLTLLDGCKQAYLSPVSLINNAINIKIKFYSIKVSLLSGFFT